jgi:hypothetical protein
MLNKGDCLRLNIFACYSWEMLLSVGLYLSFDKLAARNLTSLMTRVSFNFQRVLYWLRSLIKAAICVVTRDEKGFCVTNFD